VRGAYSGGEAPAAAEETRPDAVILDIGMPGMSGCTVAQRLAQLAGFDHHLLKPCDPGELIRLLAPLSGKA
jgi:DNA-binding NarL/FixJ family response regulator